jgi:CheY-like chemotaxis protein/REP element-mobilizing transposase RayT
MAAKVLVVTPYMALGRLIRQSLEQSAYEVQVTETAEDALELALQSDFSVAILDADVNNLSIIDLSHELLADSPNLHLVVMPPNNDPDSPLLDELPPHAFLSKPFYLPDLLQTIEGLLSGNPDDPDPDEKDPAPTSAPWYEDPDQTFDHLSSISLGPGIHEAIITCAGELWADVGQLTPEAASELAATTIRYWDEGENGDLARFINLKSNGCQYYLYATHLLGNQVLTLIFDSNMPFSRIRSQSNQLARSLINSSTLTLLPNRASRTSTPQPAQGEDPLQPLLSPLDDPMPIESDLPPLFDDIPSPDPVFQDLASLGWEKEITGEPIPTGFTRLSEPGVPNMQSQAAFPPPGLELPAFPPSNPNQPDFNPQAGVISNLTYTAVLIPRLPHHTLSEELAVQLERWMPQLSLAFGWNLQSLAIEPGQMQWVMRLSPEVAPGRMVEAIRLHTSQRIFTAFNRLAQENPSGDFWAPGFMIASGTGTFAPETLRNFIAQVRQYQTAAEF